ncbi:MAG TPA: hypothetical protein VNX26_15235 [Candidatus Acidoferrum sp.]|nr:hypothetical protein [Candidatus Acidoferrum sp.]
MLRASGGDECITCQIAEVENDTGVHALFDDPADADTWGREREVRAALIRWLCVVPEASKGVTPRGIQVRGAKVRGLLDLSAVAIPFPLTFIQSRFVDKIDLRYATILLLQFTGSAIESLNADGAEVKTMIFLDQGFSAREVRMVGANIGASLSFQQAKIKTLGVALHADRLNVKGDVSFNGFSSDGEVRMADAQIGGNLECEGGEFADVNIQRTAIKKAFFWRGVRRCTSLDLSRTSAGSFTDDEKSWQKTAEYHLDGFTYEHIIGIDTPRDAETRLNWLNHQKAFAPQPYRQLARVLHDMGYDDAAKQVLFELEGRVRAEEREGLFARHPVRGVFDSTADFLSWATIGYGIHPGWAALESIGLAGLGWIIFRRAYRLGAMVPTAKEARDTFCKGQVPEQYQPFAPLVYSVENCVPLVKFGQDERWQPNLNPSRSRATPPSRPRRRFAHAVDIVLDKIVPASLITPAFLRWFRWVMIGLGWLFATFFVAGLSGLVKAY